MPPKTTQPQDAKCKEQQLLQSYDKVDPLLKRTQDYEVLVIIKSSRGKGGVGKEDFSCEATEKSFDHFLKLYRFLKIPLHLQSIFNSLHCKLC